MIAISKDGSRVVAVSSGIALVPPTLIDSSQEVLEHIIRMSGDSPSNYILLSVEEARESGFRGPIVSMNTKEEYEAIRAPQSNIIN